MPSVVLPREIRALEIFASRDPSRTNLGFVQLTIAGSRYTATATDGYILGQQRGTFEEKLPDTTIYLSAESLKATAKIKELVLELGDAIVLRDLITQAAFPQPDGPDSYPDHATVLSERSTEVAPAPACVGLDSSLLARLASYAKAIGVSKGRAGGYPLAIEAQDLAPCIVRIPGPGGDGFVAVVMPVRGDDVPWLVRAKPTVAE